MKSINPLDENNDRVYLPLKLYWIKQIKNQVSNLLYKGPCLQNSCLFMVFVSVLYSDLVLFRVKCVILDLLSCLSCPFS